MKSILRYINSLPIRLTIRHYFPLAARLPELAGINLDSPQAWDLVRKSHPHFATPDAREAWIASLSEKRDGQDGAVSQRATDLAHLLRDRHFTSLHSIGVGSAALEYFTLQEMPELHLIVSEYNDESVARLTRVFPEGNPKKFDVLQSSWQKDSGDQNHLVLIYRLDPHLTDAQWRTVFAQLRDSQVHNVLFVPHVFLSLRYLYNERKASWKQWRPGKRASFAGYIRTRRVFEGYWAGLYEALPVTLGGKEGFLLSLPHRG